MDRPLIVLIAFVASANLYGQEAKKPSPAVTRILDEAVRGVKRNRVDFDKANQKPLGEARRALEELSTKLIKDGQADAAAAVLKQVGTLELDVMRMANAPAPILREAGNNAAPKTLSLEKLAGKWRRGEKGWVSIAKDGSATYDDDNRGNLKFIAPDVVQVDWSSGHTWHLRMLTEEILVVHESHANDDRKLDIVFHRMK